MSTPEPMPPHWRTLTTTEVHHQNADVAVLPVGSFEQHGPYLPLATDTLVASSIAERLAHSYQLRPLPPLPLSCSQEHAQWPGTVSLTSTTLTALIRDVARSLQHDGVSRLAVINGHGGNHVLINAVQEAAGPGRRLALFPDLADWQEAREQAGLESSLLSDMHAGEAEVSLLLYTHPHLVRAGYTTSDRRADDRRHLPTLGMAAYTDNGVIGHPSRASADKGAALLEGLVAAFGRHLAALRTGAHPQDTNQHRGVDDAH
ncbi:creatininase family protein [Lipingzhangella sp. LS1_29]|uniref:Creatininase family protein n=1 Tax=Lipingzhangella rawalii TaxID=2055835 RepID=A0ABU2H9L8_9ACTN|nr:creatininase family protein [Lipingzhangella rawalii]MDS1271294.1 creatininase family protein [Lipingzhangella rawalii]